ncbi:MAG TPA: hypothetical protein VIQ97_05895 [Prevotella sp.]
MKKTTYMAVGMLLFMPFAVLLPALMPAKKADRTSYLNKIAHLHLQPVKTVMFEGRFDLLDSASVNLQLLVEPDTMNEGCSIDYPSQIFQVSQKNGMLYVSVTDEGKELLRNGNLLLQDTNPREVDTDTIYCSDTLKIRLRANGDLSNIQQLLSQTVTLRGMQLPELEVRSYGTIELEEGTSIARFHVLGNSNLYLGNAQIGHMRIDTGQKGDYGVAMLSGDRYHIGTLIVTGNGGITGLEADRCDHLQIVPTKMEDMGIEVSFNEVVRPWTVK